MTALACLSAPLLGLGGLLLLQRLEQAVAPTLPSARDRRDTD